MASLIARAPLSRTAGRDRKFGRSGCWPCSVKVLGNVGRVADALPGRPSPLGATPRDGGTNFAVASSVAEGAEVFDYSWDDHDALSSLDSAGHVPLSLVTEPGFDWGSDVPLRRDYADTVLYEAHVKGFTMRRPDVPPDLRGTYAGLAHEAVLQYLTGLGVTAVELLPVHQYVPEEFLLKRGLTNYWGYNTIGYFAPHAAYSAAVRAGDRGGGQVAEFKAMVRAMHQAGLEVILDVVFNHTAEGGEGGPSLCFRGLDNTAYYRLNPGHPDQYYDTTGTGNSLDAGSPVALRLIMDSLRYWLTEMHVDGFRFDLAATLARQDGGFSRMSARSRWASTSMARTRRIPDRTAGRCLTMTSSCW
jgi:isoamylase